MTATEIAAALESAVAGAAVRLRAVGEDEAGRDRGAGRWVKKEILGHLIDSASNNHQRFVRAPLADRFSWPGYDQVHWVRVHRYRERPWLELVELWVAWNRQVAVAMEAVPAEKLDTPCHIGDAAPASLEWWMRDYLRHLHHHLGQIEGM